MLWLTKSNPYRAIHAIKRAVGKTHRQSLRKQLQRCGKTAECNHRQLESLDFASAPVFVINGLKREELIASNSMILHELYFDSLGSQGEPDKELSNALARDFGSGERWQAQFVAMGKALGGGSGWVLLTYSHRDKKLVNQWAADHTCCLAGASPILALDMYEHSYHMDYGAAAGAYVDAFMNNINWQNASALYEQNAR